MAEAQSNHETPNRRDVSMTVLKQLVGIRQRDPAEYRRVADTMWDGLPPERRDQLTVVAAYEYPDDMQGRTHFLRGILLFAHLQRETDLILELNDQLALTTSGDDALGLPPAA